jgi:hypothetical protein
MHYLKHNILGSGLSFLLDVQIHRTNYIFKQAGDYVCHIQANNYQPGNNYSSPDHYRFLEPAPMRADVLR